MSRPKKAHRASGPSGKHLGVAIILRARDEAQRDRWRATADKMGQSLSNWIREVLDTATHQASTEPPRVRGGRGS